MKHTCAERVFTETEVRKGEFGMEQREIRKLVNRQRRFFYTGKTQHMAFREMALRRLQISIMAHEDEINRALRLDLGKSASEAYMSASKIRCGCERRT